MNAGLEMDDIDGLSTYPGGMFESGFAEGGITALEAALRLRPTWFNGGAEVPGPGGSLIAAMLAVSAGLVRHVLCFRTVWQSTHDQLTRTGALRPGSGRIPGDMTCDGAMAVVVSAAETAGDLRAKPVRVEAVGSQVIERLEWDLRPADVDVAELYDGFSFNCLSWIEALGFCGIGEAKDFLDGGKNIARDGVLPLNTHDGPLSHGRTHGMGLVHEAVTQLRGDAGARQVPGARVAVVSSGGLTPGGAMLLRADG